MAKSLEKELSAIFLRTINVNFEQSLGISKNEYMQKVLKALSDEIVDSPELSDKNGPLASYIKISVLVLAIIKVYEECELKEDKIGQLIYKLAESYFHLNGFSRFIKKQLFFSNFNLKQIKKREESSNKKDNGINGFKLKLNKTNDKNKFSVDYLQCGICDYYRKKNMFKYVKYCCLTDYAIMKNLGISFSRKSTIGNGGSKCDFSFSKIGEITEGWPPHSLDEFKK